MAGDFEVVRNEEASGEDEMQYLELDGSKVVLQFKIPWCGWECDENGWMTEDGRLWGSNHGSPGEFEDGEFERWLAERQGWVAGMESALERSRKIRSGNARNGQARTPGGTPAGPTETGGDDR